MNRSSLVGWRRVVVEGGVMLVPPDGAGVIRIATREPLRPIGVVMAELARHGLGGRPVAPIAPARAFVTEEGEHAAVFGLRATGEPRVLERHVGVVFGDAHVAIVDGRVGEAADFARYADLVERITRAWCMGLGADRWRRYYYHPPAGWAGLSRHQGDVWLAPGYPARNATISVFHARPERSTRAIEQHGRLFEHLTSEYVPLGPSAANPLRADSGLIGEIALFEARHGAGVQHAANVGFTDGRYTYLLRLESDAATLDEATTMFRRVYESIEPVPRASVDLSTLVHWSE
ncbi:MAG: hypothetical protein K8W52_09720 [Deltaproteobacteria bacterium]|nr:hypothetical protein [Deltaproteobacteria bacterium]